MSTQTQAGTQPLEFSPRLTVKTLSVEVLDGPNKGHVTTVPEERLTVGTSRANDLVLTDGTVSRFHLELINEADGVQVRDLGSKNGTWLSTAAIERARVPLGSELTVGRTRLVIHDGDSKAVDALPVPELHGILGAHPSMRRVMKSAERAAPSGVAALITGESGTGKELVARALHSGSDRAEHPFVVVDCGALTPSLITSALFGHEKGAFTGAERRHIGAFERADGGTVFLDEVGELPPELQPLLLGVLERKTFLRVGGTQEIKVNVRVVSATNRDLRGEVNRGAFREDLYYRLAVLNLELPPLRQRLEDLSFLAEHFLRETGSALPFDQVFDSKTLEQMKRHDWPGNVRELRNFVEATVALGEAPEHRPQRTQVAESDGISVGEELLEMRYSEARAALLHRFEETYLSALIGRTGGNVSGAARTASMDRSYLIKLLDKHGLK